MPPPLPFPAGTEGSILLIEEYDALAAAITAALKKFAPGRAVRVFPSLALASTASEAPPALVIIDFDPPLAGTLDFLVQLRRAAPKTRVIVIAAGLPGQLLCNDRFPSALTFIEKPFQLVELGACIQGLLRPAVAGAENGTDATLQELHLADIIPLLGLERVTEVVNVTAADRELTGQIHFARGQIQHAAASGLQGIDALREMLRWRSPDFARAESDAETPRSIEGRWPLVLEEVLRSIPRPLSPRLPAPQDPLPIKKATRKKAPPVPRDGKKVLVIDDTEPLREFVEEMLSTADPRMQIRSAADGAEGLRDCFSFRPDLILLDYSLPDFNGDEVCRRLLADEATRQIPIIMMSGHVAEMAQTAASYENVVLTLSKPFVSAALVDAVTNTLANPPERKRRKSGPALAESEHKPNGRSPAQAPPAEIPAPPAPAPAHLPVANSDAVVLSLALEVTAMKFSPTLRITELRARPSSRAALLHVDPRAVSAVRLPEVPFEIDHVDLDARGQMQSLRIVPAPRQQEALRLHAGVPVDRLTVLQGDAGSGIQITPAAEAHMTVQLLAAFDLTGVELSPTFGVAHFLLKTRGQRMRAVLPGHGGKTGIILETTEVRLDAAARIAEISLHAIAN